ncbi:unnamed protein product [Diatraea saccharalis]|uniref:Uncharacterized protein n=1 Tax=Diatraea saccharalis TaxID=40085 RepID=A0A9N9WCA2_9NEOP|nr:unnamed protein product [Diatraea saccharalis]
MSEEVRMSEARKKQPRRRKRILEPQAGPSSSIPLNSPIKKRKPTTLSIGEKQLITNIYKYVKNTWSETEYQSNQAMVAKTAEISGVSVRSIYGILREYKDTHIFEPKGTTKKKLNVIDKLDSFEKTAIRQKVHSFFMEGSSSLTPLNSPIKKRKPTTLSIGEKQLITNIYKYVKNTWPETENQSNQTMVAKTAEINGVSVRSIYGILREYKDTHTFEPKGTTKKEAECYRHTG